jgi:uncharacterized protein (DUF58 family)
MAEPAPNSGHTPHTLTESLLALRWLFAGSLAALTILAGAGGGFFVVQFAFFLGFAAVISFALSAHTVRGLHSRRQLRRNSACEDGIAEMTVCIDNASSFTGYVVAIQDSFPPAGSALHQLSLTTPLHPLAQTEVPVAFSCKAKRGSYQVGPMRLWLTDSLGLFTLSATDFSEQPFRLYPAPVAMDELSLRGEARPYSFGAAASSRTGNSMDAIGVREYGDHDDPRHIHWSATAKMGEVMVREFDTAGATQLTLFLDFSQMALCGMGRHSTIEYSIKIAGSVAGEAIARGHQLQVIADCGTPLHFPFAAGPAHLAAVMNALATVRAEGQTPLYSVLERYLPAVPDHSSVVIVFAKCDIDVERYVAQLNRLRGGGVDITAVIIDHTTFVPIYANHQFARADAAHERLLAQGLTIYRVGNAQDLEAALAMPVAVADDGGYR